MQASALYADRIELLTRISCPADVKLLDLLPFLQRHGFRSIYFGRRLVGRVHIDALHTTIPVRITRASRTAPLSVYFDANMLSMYHRQRPEYNGEVALDRKLNWLHPDDIEPDNSKIVRMTGQLIATINSYLFNLVQRSIQSIRMGYAASAHELRIISLEVTADIAARDPLGKMAALAPTFRRLHGPGQVEYKIVSFEGSDRNSPMLVSNSHSRGRYKIYPKTNRRIRFECRLNRSTLSSRIRRTPFFNVAEEFPTYFLSAAEHVLPQFNAMLGVGSENTTTDTASVAEFLSALCHGYRSKESLQTLIAALIANARVETSLDRNAIYRLQRQGILVQCPERGYRTVHDRFERALNILRSANNSFYRTSIRRLTIRPRPRPRPNNEHGGGDQPPRPRIVLRKP